jgi:hypothetical protein
VVEAEASPDAGLLVIHPSVEFRRFDNHVIARNPKGDCHYYLTHDEADFLSGCDGSPQRIDGASRTYRALAERAREDGYFEGHEAAPPEGRRFVLETRRFEALARFAYQIGMRHLLRPVVAAVLAAASIGVVGFVVVGLMGGGADFAPVTPGLELAIVSGLLLVSTALHELGHASVIVGNGRRVGEAGFDFYLGSISFYVNSGDALMLDRRQRVKQAVAGVYLDLLVAGVAASVALLATGTVSSVAARLASLLAVNILLNLAPILQLDGHWLLADLLDRPRLNPDARAAAGAWLRKPNGFPNMLALYWFGSVLCGVVLTVFAVQSYLFVYWPLVREAMGDSLIQQIVVVVLMAPLVIAVVTAMLNACFVLASTLAQRRDRSPRRAVVDALDATLGDEPLTPHERSAMLSALERLDSSTEAVDSTDRVFCVNSDGRVTSTCDDSTAQRWRLPPDAQRWLGLTAPVLCPFRWPAD